ILCPKLSKKFDRYSIVESYGLTFLYEYLNETQVGRLEDLGNYPSNFPLFYQWHEISDAQIEEQAKILGNGLFHPGRIHVLRTYDDRHRNEEFIQTLIRNDNDIAALVEEWGLILLGVSASDERSEMTIHFERLLNCLIQEDERRADRLSQAIGRRVDFLMRSKLGEKGGYTKQVHLKSLINNISADRRWQILQRISLHLNPQLQIS
ncbi:MAG: hypothetical protein AAFO96_29495, partial [Bacteroidota bacterium]